MVSSPINISHAFDAINVNDIDLLVSLLSKGSYPLYDMSIYAASLGNEDACLYILGILEDIDAVYGCMYVARKNGHRHLFRLLERIALNA